MTNTMQTEAKKLVTLNVTGSWQPTELETGKTAEFWAFRSCYVVHSATGTILHGLWTDEMKARRFAASMGDGDRSFAVNVEPYWYVQGFGEVA